MGAEKEFIPYTEALELKELGFDELCVMWYCEKELVLNWNKNTEVWMSEYTCSAPTFSQAFRWFREKYNLNSIIIDSKSYNWYFNINDMQIDDVISEVLYFNTYKEAELECLVKLIEIVKDK